MGKIYHLSKSGDIYEVSRDSEDTRRWRNEKRQRLEKEARANGTLFTSIDEAISYLEKLRSDFEAAFLRPGRTASAPEVADWIHPGLDFNVLDTETLMIMQDSIRAAEELEAAGELSTLSTQRSDSISDAEAFFARNRPSNFDPANFFRILEALYKELYRQFQKTHQLVKYHESKNSAFRLVSERLAPLRAPLRWGDGRTQRNFLMPLPSDDDRSTICSQQLTMFNYLDKVPDQPTLRELNRMHLSKDCNFSLDWFEAYLAWLFLKDTAHGARAVVCKARGALEDIIEPGEKRRDKIRKHLTTLEGWFIHASNFLDTTPSVKEEIERLLSPKAGAR